MRTHRLPNLPLAISSDKQYNYFKPIFKGYELNKYDNVPNRDTYFEHLRQILWAYEEYVLFKR